MEKNINYSKLTKGKLIEELNIKLLTLTKAELVNLLKSFSNVKESNILELIDDSGIKELSSNGGKKQDIIFKYKDLCWKLSILSESYSFQSYIRLYSGDLKNWTLVKSGNPKRDYDIDISYNNRFSQEAFKPIIEDFKKLIIKLS